MDSQLSPPVRRFLPAAILLGCLGLAGLTALITKTEPNGGTRWAFFFLSVLAVSGLSMPMLAFLNQRFPSLPPPTPAVIVRQSLWPGIFFATLAWLQVGRVLTPAISLLLAIGLTLIEALLRLRERSQWDPESASRQARAREELRTPEAHSSDASLRGR